MHIFKYIGYPIYAMECCKMKGFLSYLILWNLSKKSMTGAELAKELEKRKEEFREMLDANE